MPYIVHLLSKVIARAKFQRHPCRLQKAQEQVHMINMIGDVGRENNEFVEVHAASLPPYSEKGDLEGSLERGRFIT